MSIESQTSIYVRHAPCYVVLSTYWKFWGPLVGGPLPPSGADWISPKNAYFPRFVCVFSEHPCPPDSCTKICGVCPKYVVFDLETLRICQNLWYLAQTPHFWIQIWVESLLIEITPREISHFSLVKFQILPLSPQKRDCTRIWWCFTGRIYVKVVFVVKIRFKQSDKWK